MPGAISRIWTYEVENVKFDKQEDGSRTITGVASSARQDRQKEVVNPRCLLRQLKKAQDERGGLILTWQHRLDMPLGYVTDFGQKDGKVWTTSKVLPEGKRAECDLLISLLEIGAPFSQSLGFNSIDRSDLGKSGDYDGDHVWHWGGTGDGVKDIDLIELAAVTVGANQDATLHLAKGMGLDTDLPGVVVEKSWGDLSDNDIRNAIYAHLQPAQGDKSAGQDWSLDALYEDHCIARNYSDNKTFRLTFTVMDGEVQFGEKVQVEQVWVESKGVLRPAIVPEKGDEREQYEEQRFLDEVKTMTGLLERARNMTRHWSKEQREPSQEILDQVLRPVGFAVEVLRAGRVLSDANRAAIIAAEEALREVLGRDDASRGKVQGKNEADEEAAMMPKGATLNWRKALLGDLAEAV